MPDSKPVLRNLGRYLPWRLAKVIQKEQLAGLIAEILAIKRKEEGQMTKRAFLFAGQGAS